MTAFIPWAARRVFGLVNRGIGLLSTLATIALFVVPSFVGAVPRWWALAPLAVYVIVALLHEEYKRVSSPCLNAKVEEETEVTPRGHTHHQNFLRIENCGPITVEHVTCEMPDHARAWQLHTDSMEYPLPALESGESTRLLLLTFVGSPAQVRATLRGEVNGEPYERTKLLSLFG
jgi:hypothetical protein